jgi:hypothetical protein
MRGFTLTPKTYPFALLILFGLFWAITGVALLLGATDLGTAMTFGQIGFAAAVTAVLLFGK